MNKNAIMLIPVVLLTGSPLLAAEATTPATNDQELDLIMQGFEESKPQESSMDEIMQGFENTTPANSESIDEVLQGFEQTDFAQSPDEASMTTERRAWDLITLVSLSSSYNYQHQTPAADKTDYRGISRLKLKIQPEFRYQINPKWDSVISASGFYDFAYRINGRDNYTSQVLDVHESELEFREAYIRGSVSSAIDITIGRQIVVWGKADSVRVIDILNPLDFREPGMVDIEDLRLPVFMFKADYYFDNWNLSGLVIPEIRTNKNPAWGSDFYFGDADKPAPSENMPDDFENQEYALALKGSFQGWDVSFHWAQVFDDQPYMTNPQISPTLNYAQLTMSGIATNIALGNWVMKAEVAYIDGIKFAKLNPSFNRADAMLGFDYSGFTDTSLSVEAAARHIFEYQSAIEDTSENEGQIFFRYTGTFLREKLEVTALISVLGFTTDDGAFYRGSVQYELMDAMTIQAGGIVYQSGDSRISQVAASNDRVFLDWRYTF